MMSTGRYVSILGAGMGGLSVGYYAKKRGVPFTLFEAGDAPGGNCRTFRHGDFFLDSGAHRLHDKNPNVTSELMALLGEDLVRISVPSQIFQAGQLFDFPLSPLNLLKNMGPLVFTRAAWEVLFSRLGRRPLNGDFEGHARYTYGSTIAERFLLNYSEKLWGLPVDRLSKAIAGARMKGLNLRTFIVEAALGKRAKTRHLDGSFYYPKQGIGLIAQRLAEFCGQAQIVTGSRVTRICHDGHRIRAVEINGQQTLPTEEVVSSLALGSFVLMLDPPAPQEILDTAATLHHRDLVLVALLINRPSVTKAATVYFPDRRFTFTRMYEPRNRDPMMSPEGRTSLVVEIPCQRTEPIWGEAPETLAGSIKAQVASTGWIDEKDVMETHVHHLADAYPILEKGYEPKVEALHAYLARFGNLHLTGRNARFQYSWIHDMMSWGKEIVERLVSKERP